MSLPSRTDAYTTAATTEVNEVAAKWFAAMRRADFAEAWRVSDRILAARAPGEQCWDLPRHEQWVWNGQPLADRRVLVRCYHGLGDTIQFARFLPRLEGIARETIVWAQPALLPLLETLPGQRRLLPLHDGVPQVEYDIDIEIMELGHALRIDSDWLAERVPYFRVPAAARPSPKMCVGLAAASGSWNPQRSVPAELLCTLTDVDGVEVFNLQLDRPLQGMRDLSTSDLLELARRIRAMDLVIAPDTMVVHLAGALAVPTWTLLPFDSDWRWLQPERSDTPWYPAMRLFRQPRPGDWESVVARLLQELSISSSAR
jgi:hypothetical protein